MRYIVYKIFTNEFIYYGYTEDYNIMIESNLFTLRNKKHTSGYLQTAYNKSPANVKFSVIKEFKHKHEAKFVMQALIDKRDNKSEESSHEV